MYPACFYNWQDLPSAGSRFLGLDFRLALILLVVSFLLFLKFRKFPGILLPPALIAAVLFYANLGTLRDEFRFRQAKFEIAGNAEKIFNEKFRKPVMILPRDAFVNGNGERQKTDPVYALQGYAGQSGGHSVEAVSVLAGHDCDVGLLVRAHPDAMKFEFQSRAERLQRELYLSKRYNEASIKHQGHVDFPDDDAMRVKIVEVNEMARNPKAISAGLNWCRNISDRFFYCEASGTDLALASGIRF